MKESALSEESRYLNFFGLEHNPFPVAPDDENFYVSKHIDQILTEIVHGTNARKGFMVLTGDIGLGKTTISRRIISILEEKGVETSLVFHTAYQDVELLREINRDFGIETDSMLFGDQMKILNDFLLEQNSQGKNCSIIIDDAQNLNYKSLELVRMISNLETNQQKLVQILLVGQPELMDKLNSKELRQLKSRIIIRKEAKPLALEEMKNYLLFKLNLAGNKGQITIEKDALGKIYQFSKGNFRQINILMDRCLYVAFLYNTAEIGKQVVKEACADICPEKFGPKKVRLILALSIVLFATLVGVFIYHDLFMDIFFNDSGKASIQVQQINKRPVNRQVPAVTEQESGSIGSAESVPADNSKGKADMNIIIPAAVTDFLQACRLSAFEESFFTSLKNNRFHELTQTIFDKTGYWLIRLDDVPDYIQGEYDVLANPSKDSGKETFYLFWKPALRLTKYYYHYWGEDIMALQEMMANIDLYNDFLDGIVGKNLMKAVNNFQKQMGLPVTGYPDERTIFLLCHQKENVLIQRAGVRGQRSVGSRQ